MFFNVEYYKTDKLGRPKHKEHLGIFDREDKLEAAKAAMLEKDPSINFNVYVVDFPSLKVDYG
jgi:hypothetical protein